MPDDASRLLFRDDGGGSGLLVSLGPGGDTLDGAEAAAWLHGAMVAEVAEVQLSAR